jgi:TRAP-type C4-dicarboxylate transport system substrate-binding protein
MKSIFRFAALAFAGLFVFFSVIPAHAQPRQLATHRWKFATLAPDGVGWARHIKGVVLPAVKDVMQGDMAIQVYWGGVMGDEPEYIQKMRINQLQGAGFTGSGAALVCPEITILELPFLFNNYKEVDFIKSRMSATFDGLFRERGFFMLALVDQDFDQIYGLHKPIAKAEDFQGVRFVEWYGVLEAEMLKMLGARPITVGVPEISSATRQGVVDAAIGPGLWVVGAQLYTVIKYINPIKIRYSPSVIAVTTGAWDALPDQYQQAYFDIREKVMDEYSRLLRDDNERGLEAMYSYGLTKVETSPRDLEILKAKTRPLWDNMVDKLYPRELLEEMLGYLDEHRGTGRQVRGTWSATRPAAPAVPAVETPSPAARPATPPSAASPAPQAAASAPSAAPATQGTMDRKALILAVQTKLKEKGYYDLAIDGVFGPRTFWGIKRYQRDNGMAETGAIDTALMQSMGIE